MLRGPLLVLLVVLGFFHHLQPGAAGGRGLPGNHTQQSCLLESLNQHVPTVPISVYLQTPPLGFSQVVKFLK